MKGIGLGIVVIVLAGCQGGSKPVGQEPTILKDGVGGQEPMKLKDGVVLADVYVNDDQALQSWAPDGKKLDSYRSTALDEVTAEERTVLPNPDGYRSIRVELELPHGSDMPSVAFKEDGVFTPATGTLLIEGHRWVSWYAKPFKGKKDVDVSVGVSNQAWQVVGTYRWSNKKAEHVSGQQFKPKLTTQGAEGNESVLLAPASQSESTSMAFRYVLKDKKGSPLQSAGSADRQGTRTYWFRGSLGDVATIELQSRPFEWIDLGRVNVAGN